MYICIFSHLKALETLDNGMTITNSSGIAFASAQVLRYHAGWADKIQGKTIPIGKELNMSKERIQCIPIIGKVLNNVQRTYSVLSNG